MSEQILMQPAITENSSEKVRKSQNFFGKSSFGSRKISYPTK